MKICKPLFLTALFSLAAVLSAQSGQPVTMPKGPASPVMPSVSAPAVGNGFYVPGSAGFYQGQKKIPAPAQDNGGNESKDSEAKGSAAPASSAVSAASGLASQYSAASQLSQSLTASDLSSLDSLGMLGNFSSLLGTNNRNTLNSASNSVVLQRILTELEELKASVNSASVAAAVSEKQPQGPSILRFVINGNDILSSCRTVFFSKPESDGSFLLTGDRKYTAGGKTRSETFHLLFRASGTKNSCTSFNVSPALTQDYENTSSLLYKLSQNKNLTASRTGNLLTLRCTENGVTTDLLLSME